MQPIRALDHAIQLIKAEKSDSSKKPNMIIGVVGASYSSVTKPFAKATLALKLPLVSYAATNRGWKNEFQMHYKFYIGRFVPL